MCALVPEYTRELAELHPAIDDILIDPGQGNPGGAPLALGQRIAAQNFDSALVLYSTTRIGLALMTAGIGYRLAPAVKLAQFFYRDTLTQRRSHSVKPEYEYNLDLARHFLARRGIDVDGHVARPVLPADDALVASRRRELARELGIAADARWIFVHPGHGGSANNLSVEQYASFMRALEPGPQHAIVVTAGPGERTVADALASLLGSRACVVYESRRGLGRFVEALATADLVVGGSTGPLHIAGALNLYTVAFYPRRATSSPLRWQTLNAPDRRIAAMPPNSAAERDMSAIDVVPVAANVRTRFRHLFA